MCRRETERGIAVAAQCDVFVVRLVFVGGLLTRPSWQRTAIVVVIQAVQRADIITDAQMIQVAQVML